MRKLAMAAGAIALATGSPALADRGGPSGQAAFGFASFEMVIKSTWRSAFFTPPGFFSSAGNHFGWFKGKHWGWFKPKNPHWPHDPPVSP